MKSSTSAVLLALAFALFPQVGSLTSSPAAGWPAGPSAQAQPAQAQPAQVQSAEAPPQIPLRADQIKLLRDTLAQAPSQGFGPAEFQTPGLDRLLRSADPGQRSRGQAVLISATLRYAAAVRKGRLSDSEFDHDWGMKPEPFDAEAEFGQAVMDNRLRAWLQDLPPPYLGYQQLIDGLKTYRAIVAQGGWRTIASGPAMKLGGADPRVPALRERLAAEDPDAAKAFADEGDFGPSQSPPAAGAPQPDPMVFDEPVDEAVKTFQRRHGLDATGVVDRPTLLALNVPAQTRVDQIFANMERWRWAPRTLPPDRVQVNTAAAVLTLFHDDAPVLSMRAVAGRVTDKTPMLRSTIRSVEFNPPWNVPQSIAAKELWPKERAHPGYLAREDFAVIRAGDGGVRLQQRAGPKSALGQIKFDFENPYGVYLHDTPSRSTFARESRLVSHGCVRLEQPKALAAILLAANAGWDMDQIADTIDRGDTHWVALSNPTAVLIFYWTAFAGPDGVMNFRPDPYGWDEELLQRIAAGRSGTA